MASDQRAVFRLPAAALLLPVLAVLCVTPLATAGGAWVVLFAVPVIALAYVIYTRTVADPHGLTVHTLLGRKQMAWSEMDGLEFHGSRWAIAVGADGTRFRLPMVRPRDLPRLAAVSGGSLAMSEPAAPGTGVATTDPEADPGTDPGADPEAAAGADAGAGADSDADRAPGGAVDADAPPEAGRDGPGADAGLGPGAATASPGPPGAAPRDRD